MEKKVIIYAIRCKVTGRMYIGNTVRLESVVSQQFRKLIRHQNGEKVSAFGGNVEKNAWQEDFDRYGREGFEVYVLEENVPNEREVRRGRTVHWIKEYHSDDPRYGYNRPPQETLGGDDVIYGLPPKMHEAEEVSG